MNDADAAMFSPLSAQGEQRLQRLRASIKTRFGSGSAVVRSLHMPSGSSSSSSSSGHSPRSRLRHRLSAASQVTSDEIFFQEFGSSEELSGLDFDLVRTAQPQAAATTSYAGSRVHSVETSVFESTLPARSTAAVLTNLNQVARPTRVRTPKKVTLKRSRIGESSAERAKPLQKPRLYGASSSMRSLTFGFDQPMERKSAGMDVGVSTSNAFYAHTSPSKLHFPSASTRALFAQRSAPLR